MKQRIFLAFLVFFALSLLISCETMDLLRYAEQGKNLNTVDVFGDEKLDLVELEKVDLTGFSISDFHHPLVKKHIRNYQLYGKKTVNAIINRAQNYLPMIKKIFAEKGIPADLAYLPIIESGFNPRATSHAGASGLWQFMFQTGKAYKLDANYWIDDRRDIYRSTVAASYHLRYLYKRFGNWLLVLAAYNAGSGKISRAIKKYKTKNYWKLIRGKYLKPETKNYVAKFIAASIMAQNPEKYGIVIKEVEPISVKQVYVEDATDIRLLAKLANMSSETFKLFNPALKRWATPPSTSYPIYIKEENYDDFLKSLNAVPKNQRVTYRQYFVRMGDNLTKISKKFEVPINPIATINKFKSRHDIKAGSKIVIPIQGLDKAKQLDRERRNVVSKGAKRGRGKSKLSGKHTFLYLVQPQDSLYLIALRFKVSLEDLLEWNNFKSSRSLRSGRLIIVKI